MQLLTPAFFLSFFGSSWGVGSVKVSFLLHASRLWRNIGVSINASCSIAHFSFLLDQRYLWLSFIILNNHSPTLY